MLLIIHREQKQEKRRGEEEYGRRGKVELGKGGGGAEKMKIKELRFRRSDRGEERGAGREPRLRARMRGAEVSRESR